MSDQEEPLNLGSVYNNVIKIQDIETDLIAGNSYSIHKIKDSPDITPVSLGRNRVDT